MPPKSTSKPGCFGRLVRWSVGGLGLLIAFGVVANLLPSSEPIVPNVGTPEAMIETLPLPTAESTATAVVVEVIAPTATDVAPVVEVVVAATELPVATDVPTIMATLPPVATVAPTVAQATPIPATDTPLPQVTANRDANLRGGPSIEFGVVGGVTPGQALTVVAISPDRQWAQLDNGAWIATFLIDNLRGDLPVAANIPAVPVLPTSTPVPVVVEVPPTALPVVANTQVPPTQPPPPTQVPVQNCDPSYPDFCLQPGIPDLDCKDIPYGRFRVLPPDPHGFDGNDNDGLGCESN